MGSVQEASSVASVVYLKCNSDAPCFDLAEWYLENFGRVVYAQNDGVISVECNSSDEGGRVGPRTRVLGIAPSVSICICLDFSASLASLDIQRGSVLIDSLMLTLRRFTEQLLQPVILPGTDDTVTVPMLVSVVACISRGVEALPQSGVLVHNYPLASHNVDDFIERFMRCLEENVWTRHYEATLALNHLYQQHLTSVEKLTGDLFEEENTTNVPSQQHEGKTAVSNGAVSPSDLATITMLYDGVLLLDLMNREHSFSNSAKRLCVITDGVLSLPNATVLDALVNCLRTSQVSCNFIQASSPYHSKCSFGFVPYEDMMQFVAKASGGKCLRFNEEGGLRLEVSNTFTLSQSAMFLYHFQSFADEFSDERDTYGLFNWEEPQLCSKTREGVIDADLNSVLRLKFRQGYLLREIIFDNNDIAKEVVLVSKIDAEASSVYRLSLQEPHHCSVALEAPYHYLHHSTCRRFRQTLAFQRTPHRQMLLYEFKRSLRRASLEDKTLARIIEATTNAEYYQIPECFRNKLALFCLSADGKLQENSAPPDCANFLSYWKNICFLEKRLWQGVFQVEWIRVLLVSDERRCKLPVSSRRALNALTSALVSLFAHFVLVDGHTFVAFYHQNADDVTSKTFVIVRASHKGPCVLLRVAFLPNVSAAFRKEVLEQLENLFTSLRQSLGRDTEDHEALMAVAPTLILHKPLQAIEVPCCTIIHKPLEKILVRYESSMVVSPAIVANLDARRVLLGKRYVWSIYDQLITWSQPSSDIIHDLLGLLVRYRLGQNFMFAFASNGIITMLLQEKYEDNDKAHVTQFVIFPPQLPVYKNAVDGRLANEEEQWDLVTEVWLEPTTNIDGAYFTAIQKLFADDCRLMHVLLTFEHVVSVCVSKKRDSFGPLAHTAPPVVEGSGEGYFPTPTMSLVLTVPFHMQFVELLSVAQLNTIRFTLAKESTTCLKYLIEHLDSKDFIELQMTNELQVFIVDRLAQRSSSGEQLTTVWSDWTCYVKLVGEKHIIFTILPKSINSWRHGPHRRESSAMDLPIFVLDVSLPMLLCRLCDNFQDWKDFDYDEYLKDPGSFANFVTSPQLLEHCSMLWQLARTSFVQTIFARLQQMSECFMDKTDIHRTIGILQERRLDLLDLVPFMRCICHQNSFMVLRLSEERYPIATRLEELFYLCGVTCGGRSGIHDRFLSALNDVLRPLPGRGDCFITLSREMPSLALSSNASSALATACGSGTANASETDTHDSFDEQGPKCFGGRAIMRGDVSSTTTTGAEENDTSQTWTDQESSTTRRGSLNTGGLLEALENCPFVRMEIAIELPGVSKTIFCPFTSLPMCFNGLLTLVHEHDTSIQIEDLYDANISLYVYSLFLSSSNSTENSFECRTMKDLIDKLRWLLNDEVICARLEGECPVSRSWLSQIMEHVEATPSSVVPRQLSHSKHSINALFVENSQECFQLFLKELRNVELKNTYVIQESNDDGDGNEADVPSVFYLAEKVVSAHAPIARQWSASRLMQMSTTKHLTQDRRVRKLSLPERYQHGYHSSVATAASRLTATECDDDDDLDDDDEREFKDNDDDCSEGILTSTPASVVSSSSRKRRNVRTRRSSYHVASTDYQQLSPQQQHDETQQHQQMDAEQQQQQEQCNSKRRLGISCPGDLHALQSLCETGDSRRSQPETDVNIVTSQIAFPPPVSQRRKRSRTHSYRKRRRHPLEEGGYEGDSSASEQENASNLIPEQSDNCSAVTMSTRKLPPFYIIIAPSFPKVVCYLHIRWTESSEVHRAASNLFNMLWKVISDIIRRVNQYQLLQRLHLKRICDPLLNKLATSETSGKLIREEEMEEMRLICQSWSPGMFACPVAWYCHLPLHPRLPTKRNPSGYSVGLQALRAALDRFAVTNVTNMYVYQEPTGEIFYIRLYDSHETNGDEEVSVCSSQASLAKTRMTSEDETEQHRASVSTQESASAPSRAKLDCLRVDVHGIGKPGESICVGLLSTMRNRLDETVLEALTTSLSRSDTLNLTIHDVDFIQPPGKPPTQEILIPIPLHLLPYLQPYMAYLIQNLRTFLLNPRYASKPPITHTFRPYPTERPSVSDDIFLFRQFKAAGAPNPSVACVVLSLLNASVHQPPNAYDDPQIAQALDFNALCDALKPIPVAGNAECETDKSPGALGYIRYQLWYIGKGGMETLCDRLIKALHWALADVIIEYQLMSHPLVYSSDSITTARKAAASEPPTPVKAGRWETRSLGSGILSPSVIPGDAPPPIYHSPSEGAFSFCDSSGAGDTFLSASNLWEHELNFPGSPTSHQSLLTTPTSKFFADFVPGAALNPQLNDARIDAILRAAANRGAPSVSIQTVVCRTHLYGVQLVKDFGIFLKNGASDLTFEIFKQTTDNVFQPFYCSSELYDAYSENEPLGTKKRLLLIARDDELWNNFARNDLEQAFDHLESVHQKAKKLPLMFHMRNEMCNYDQRVPRQRFLSLLFDGSECTLYLYNFSVDQCALFFNYHQHLVDWQNMRARFTDSIVRQKLGLFHWTPIERELQRGPCCSSTADDSAKRAKKTTEDHLFGLLDHLFSRSAHTQRPTGSGQHAPCDLRLNGASICNATRYILRNRPPKRPMHQIPCSKQDPAYRHGRQFLSVKNQLRQQVNLLSGDMHHDKAVINKTPMDTLLDAIHRQARPVHYCLTPLLFHPGWRAKIAQVRDHTLESLTSSLEDSGEQQQPQLGAGGNVPPRQRHVSGGTVVRSLSATSERPRRFSGNPASFQSRGITPRILAPNSSSSSTSSSHHQPDYETWHAAVCAQIMKDYVQYLCNLGFVPFSQQTPKVATPSMGGDGLMQRGGPKGSWGAAKRTPAPRQCLFRWLFGGLMILELTFTEPYLACSLFLLENRRGDQLHCDDSQHFCVSLAEETDKIRVLLHLHSFAYDFHLRAIHNYISGQKLLFKHGYHLTSFLDDFVKYYQKAPSFARNLIYSAVIHIEDITMPPQHLYNYLIGNNRTYDMNVLRMVHQDDVVQDPEYALVEFSTRRIAEIEEEGTFNVAVLTVHDTSFTSASTNLASAAPSVVMSGDFNVGGAAAGGNKTGIHAIALRYYILLISRREQCPKLLCNTPEDSAGCFEAVRRQQSTSSGALHFVPLGMNNPAPQGRSRASSTVSAADAPRSRGNSVRAMTDEAVLYVGFYSSYERQMQKMVNKQARCAHEQLRAAVKRAAVDCRRDYLWQKLVTSVDTKESLVTDFEELMTLVKTERLEEIDTKLLPFNLMQYSWYDGLVKFLMGGACSQFANNNRYYGGSSHKRTYFIVLSPDCVDSFMLISLDSRRQEPEAFVCAVHRLEEGRKSEGAHALIEDFVNACAVHTWHTLVVASLK